jgi:hypothetical protein
MNVVSIVICSVAGLLYLSFVFALARSEANRAKQGRARVLTAPCWREQDR